MVSLSLLFILHVLAGLVLFILSNKMSSHFLVSSCDIVYDFLVKTVFCSSLLQFVLSGFHILLMLFVFIYVVWCPTRFSCQMMFVSYNSNIMGTTSIAGTVCILLEHLSAHPGFIGVRVTQSLVFCLVFYRPLFVLFVVCLLGIILSALPLTASNYLFGIVKHFLLLINR